MVDQMKFVESHNVAGYLMDPPPAHKEFKSMIAGLNNCRISHALRATPIIRKSLVTEFWKNASFRCAGDNSAEAIKSTIQGKPILVTEQIIREVLEFGDKPEFPTELSVAKITEVLKRMGYEGVFPPTAKKLLPPYWRFLAHTFMSCLSGRKGGLDELSQTTTAAFVSLAMDWEYNFSRFIFDEMQSNLTSKKKDVFLMYPRFLQMIFDSLHSELERTPDTLDVKSLGPTSFGLMKQQRKNTKVVFKGKEPLIKFGKFAEIEEVQSTPTTIVAEEHDVPPRSNLCFSLEISDDSEDDDDVNVLFSESNEEQVNEAVTPPVETEIETVIFEQSNSPTDEQVDSVINLLQSTARNPPQAVPVTHESTSASDKEDPDQSPLIRKRKRRDPRPGVLITEPTQQPDPIPEIQEHSSPILNEDTFVAGGSSHASGSSSGHQAPPQYPKEAESVRLAHFLASQDSDPLSKGKGISLEGSNVNPQSHISELKQEIFVLKQELIEKDLLIGNLDVRVSKLENDNSLKTKQISELQANLVGLSALYFDLKQQLSQKFGDNFQPSGSATQTDQAAPSESENIAARPAPDSNMEPILSHGPSTGKERIEKHKKIDEMMKRKLLLMKNSDQNTQGDEPHMFIKELGKRRFEDKYGDRSGIKMWGYDDCKNLWVVKRKNDRIEYYEKKVVFSETKVD